MDPDSLRNRIQQWVKHNKSLSSPLGFIHLGEKLGEGGTALVYASEFLGGSAVKFLVEEITDPPSSRLKRFLDEYCNLLKLVRTDRVVALYHFGEADIDGARIPYIVMEYASPLRQDTKSAKIRYNLEQPFVSKLPA